MTQCIEMNQKESRRQDVWLSLNSSPKSGTQQNIKTPNVPGCQWYKLISSFQKTMSLVKVLGGIMIAMKITWNHQAWMCTIQINNQWDIRNWCQTKSPSYLYIQDSVIITPHNVIVIHHRRGPFSPISPCNNNGLWLWPCLRQPSGCLLQIQSNLWDTTSHAQNRTEYP